MDHWMTSRRPAGRRKRNEQPPAVWPQERAGHQLSRLEDQTITWDSSTEQQARQARAPGGSPLFVPLPPPGHQPKKRWFDVFYRINAA